MEATINRVFPDNPEGNLDQTIWFRELEGKGYRQVGIERLPLPPRCQRQGKPTPC